jgi:hypothetical protein
MNEYQTRGLPAGAITNMQIQSRKAQAQCREF